MLANNHTTECTITGWHKGSGKEEFGPMSFLPVWSQGARRVSLRSHDGAEKWRRTGSPQAFQSWSRRVHHISIFFFFKTKVKESVILWFVISIYLVFVPCLRLSFKKPGNFLSDENNKGVFCLVNEVTSGQHLRVGPGCQENQPCD